MLGTTGGIQLEQIWVTKLIAKLLLDFVIADDFVVERLRSGKFRAGHVDSFGDERIKFTLNRMGITAAVKHFTPGGLRNDGFDQSNAIIEMDQVGRSIRLLDGFTTTEKTARMAGRAKQSAKTDNAGGETRVLLE